MAKLELEKHTEDEVLGLFEQFLKEVEDNEYKTLPTKSRFADFLGQPRREVMRYFALHSHAEAKMKAMIADTLIEGAMLKKYVPNATMHALKNICGWEDNPKQSKAQASKQESDDRKAKRELDEYIKEQGLLMQRKKKKSDVEKATVS